MPRRIPIAGTPITAGDLAAAFRCDGAVRQFEKALGEYFGKGEFVAADSGKAALYLLLKALMADSGKKEVIVPAYTADSVVLAVREAGLTPVLCDISLDTFNMDTAAAEKAAGHGTLAAVAVHMFGLACDVPALKTVFEARGVYVIEDCAQSLGTRIGGKMAGILGDAGFFSFNRGKNLPTYSGGALVAGQEIADRVRGEICRLPSLPVSSEISSLLKIVVLSLVSRPDAYFLLSSHLGPFKKTSSTQGFRVAGYGPLRANVGRSLLKRTEGYSRTRHEYGMLLLERLRAVPGLRLPKVLPGSQPAFNRFPVLIEEPEKREQVRARLSRMGFESSTFYPRPLHHMLDLGYANDDFPNARYFAGHLLTLPVHPFMKEAEAEAMAGAVAAAMESDR